MYVSSRRRRRTRVSRTNCFSGTLRMKSMSRLWVSSRCRSTSERDNFRFRSVVMALNASIPPYMTEYLGVFSPARMRGKCLRDSSSHEVTWAIMSLIDQVSMTQDSIIVESDRPEYASFSVCQASSKRFKRSDLFKVSSRTYKIFYMCRLILSAQRSASAAGAQRERGDPSASAGG